MTGAGASTDDPVYQTLERLQSLKLRPAESSSSSSDAPAAAAAAKATTEGAYTILLQSLSLPLDTRQTLTASSASTSTNAAAPQRQKQQPQQPNDDYLYQQAGLLTPAQAAYQDWYGASLWWTRLVTQVLQITSTTADLKNNSSNNKGDGNPGLVLYVQTIPESSPLLPQTLLASSSAARYLHVLDLTQNPWGWDERDDNNDNDDNDAPACGMNSLSEIIKAVETKIETAVAALAAESSNATPSITIILDSLSPLYMRHGGPPVLHFIQYLQHLQPPHVSTVLLLRLTDQVTSTAFARALQDQVQAYLALQQGQAVWMHQGIRQRDNMVRQTIPYQIVTRTSNNINNNNRNSAASIVGAIQLVESSNNNVPPSSKAVTDTSTTTTTTPGTSTMVTSTEQSPSETTVIPSTGTTSSRAGRTRVKLQLEEEKEDVNATSAITNTNSNKNHSALPSSNSSQGPRIFLQDDDPEFEDYDEEDPDDDLDI